MLDARSVSSAVTLGVIAFGCIVAADAFTLFTRADEIVPTATPAPSVMPETPAPAAVPEVVPVIPAPEPEQAPAPHVPTPAPQPNPVEPPAPAIRKKNGVTAWMDINDWESAVQSLQVNASKIGDISPAWYLVTREGTVVPRPGIPVNDARVLAAARDNGVLLRPIVMNIENKEFRADLVRAIFNDPAKRAAHVDDLLTLVLENGYDGIDIDYEGLSIADHEGLAVFLEELSAAFHAKGKSVAVSIQALPNDALIPSWQRIGVAADDVRLMAYGQKHKTPSPIVNLDALRGHLARALKAIPADKLSHGMPTYCFTWQEGRVGSGTWRAYLYGMPQEIVQRDAATKSPWYASAGRTVWCEDAQSIEHKMQLARSLGITNFALWRIGGEDPAIWR